MLKLNNCCSGSDLCHPWSAGLITTWSVNLSLTNILFLCYTELEALEACYWLKAAGFPQYAQAYEGNTIEQMWM